MSCYFCSYWIEDPKYRDNYKNPKENQGVCIRYPKLSNTPGGYLCGEFRMEDKILDDSPILSYWIQKHEYWNLYNEEKEKRIKLEKKIKLMKKEMKKWRK